MLCIWPIHLLVTIICLEKLIQGFFNSNDLSIANTIRFYRHFYGRFSHFEDYISYLSSYIYLSLISAPMFGVCFNNNNYITRKIALKLLSVLFRRIVRIASVDNHIFLMVAIHIVNSILSTILHDYRQVP